MPHRSSLAGRSALGYCYGHGLRTSTISTAEETASQLARICYPNLHAIARTYQQHYLRCHDGSDVVRIDDRARE